MKIAILGTGMVGRALAGRLIELGHDVVIGTRSPNETLTRTEHDIRGTGPYAEWQAAHPDVRLVPFAEAGAHGEIVINATAGIDSVATLEATGAENLAGKVVLDLALPLDRTGQMPPELTIANTDSLGEQLQRAFPDARIVKTLNTMSNTVMIEPGRVPGEHNVFVSGDHDAAKDAVKDLLGQFGWPDERIIDLGGIRTARSTEMYAPLLFDLFGVLGTFDFNIAVLRAVA